MRRCSAYSQLQYSQTFSKVKFVFINQGLDLAMKIQCNLKQLRKQNIKTDNINQYSKSLHDVVSTSFLGRIRACQVSCVSILQFAHKSATLIQWLFACFGVQMCLKNLGSQEFSHWLLHSAILTPY